MADLEPYPADVRQRAAQIKLVIFDVDGVLTDGRLVFDELGREYKTFHVRDGHGIKLLQQTRVEVAVISGRASPAVALRMADLGIRHVYQGQAHKLAALQDLQTRLCLTLEEIAYVGDDVIDLGVMKQVGLAIAVADAHPSLWPYAHWRTTGVGGSGAGREVCDLIMTAQGTFEEALRPYLGIDS